ncbi:MAG: alcohol dehydrogenase catalytic domain-containing protein [Armatimonadetes bacterium]|nr:alcohol dehydrogenase catalytic domain-containing protein [Armatimonadota bacterium]
MKALLLAPQFHLAADHPEPTPGHGEALIEVDLAAICGTDLELLAGYKGFGGVPGHEFVGRVVACDNEDWLARRVVASINLGCGACPECRDHGPEHCPTRRVLGLIGCDGAFAERLVLPVGNLVPVPDDLDDAVAVWAEPLAAARHVLDLPVDWPRARVAVVGPGRLGLLCAQVLAPLCAALTVLGRREASLALPRGLGLTAALAEEAGDSAFDAVVEATGNGGGLALALRLARPRGTVVLKSTYAEPASLDLSLAVVKELALLGSRCGDVPAAVAALARGEVNVAALTEGVWPLSEWQAAFARAAEPGALKVLLRPDAAPGAVKAAPAPGAHPAPPA